MATPTSTRTWRSERPGAPLTFPVLLGLVCLLGGLSLSLSVIEQITALGGNAPYLSHVMALNAPAETDFTEALGPAGDSVGNMTFVLTIAWTAVASVLMLVAASFFLTSAQLRHPGAARRVAAVGLWMGLVVAVVAVMPFDGGWGEAGVGNPGGGIGLEGLRTGVIALLGLLLLQISAPQWRTSVRQAFRD